MMHGDTVVEPRRRQQQPDTNCDDADASMVTAPPAARLVPLTVNGSASPSTSTPAPAMRRGSSTAAGIVPARRRRSGPVRRRTRRPAAGIARTVPADRSTSAADVRAGSGDGRGGLTRLDAHPSAAERAEHEVSVAAAQYPRTVEGPVGQCRQDQGAIGDGLGSGNSTVAVSAR